MTLSNDIVLRPRFKIELSTDNEVVLKAFEYTKTTQSEFIVSRIDDHVFIKYPKIKQHFWSPQLHLEITQEEKDKSIILGLFGPNPTVWTLFMFFHFIVACLFLAFGIWTYTNISLNNTYSIQLAFTLLMVVLWFVLYLFGRLGRAKGKSEMQQLHNFMNNIINPYR
ncbi:GTP-binding protein [Winogradskyella eckloniae]|uniref:GTP-binding protein n=1 Tax=Winogradskyella eckloniae TaxID=1089306 RepID=UPI0015667ABF|nr:GTP-binding protein [Winogradskyella eckloniae]NRD21541.1 GTP-binding protein [Winogradskyella eckloniae]